MTREKEIFTAASKYIEDNSMPDGFVAITDHTIPFIEGADWADAHPKSPWISVEDDFPCNHEELIDTTRHCTVSKDVIVRHKDGSVTFERMIKNYKSQWIFLSDVTHWMPIPKLPKE